MLSHGHWDHAGGPPTALELIDKANGGRSVCSASVHCRCRAAGCSPSVRYPLSILSYSADEIMGKFRSRRKRTYPVHTVVLKLLEVVALRSRQKRRAVKLLRIEEVLVASRRRLALSQMGAVCGRPRSGGMGVVSAQRS